MVMYPLLHGSQWTPNGPNRALYKNERFDELLTEARAADRPGRSARQLYREAQKILIEDAPWVFVDHEIQIAAISKRVQGLRSSTRASTCAWRRSRSGDAPAAPPALVGRYLAAPAPAPRPVLLGVSRDRLPRAPPHARAIPPRSMLGSQATQEDLTRLRARARPRPSRSTSSTALDRSRRARRPRPLALDEASGARARCWSGSRRRCSSTGERAAALHRRRHRARHRVRDARQLAARPAERGRLALRREHAGVLARHRADGDLLARGSAGSPRPACSRPTAAAGCAISSPIWRCPPSRSPPRSVTIIARLTRQRHARACSAGTTSARRAPRGLTEWARGRASRAQERAASRSSPWSACRRGYLLGGAVLTETVFAWPGVGTLVVQGILARDVPARAGLRARDRADLRPRQSRGRPPLRVSRSADPV